MILTFIDGTFPAEREKVQPQMFFAYIGIDFLLRKNVLLADIHSRNLAGGGDSHIGIIYAVIDYFFIAMYL